MGRVKYMIPAISPPFKRMPPLKGVEALTMDTTFIYFHINWALDLPFCATEHINVKESVAIFLAVFRWCNNFLNKKVIIYS